MRAIRAVAAGERYLHPALGAALAAPAGRRAPVDELSAREREVLRMLALGHTNQEMRAGSRAEMVRHAIEAGLLDRPG
ncbi:MAG: hypothetical protein QOK40_2006 [Miltoncostaeaceae bacterium]|nr:hypothetical protein [Miltoncostaeaceae bacterium]